MRNKVIDPARPQDRRKWTHRLAGTAILLQVKGGETQVSSETDDYVRVKVADLAKHKSDWLRSPIPCALVYVEPVEQGKTPKRAWWVNLQNESVYVADTLVEVPKKNRFQPGLECLGRFSKIVKRQQLGMQLSEIRIGENLDAKHRVTGLHANGLKWEAWRFYKAWQERGATHRSLGPITINRTGWSHLTRRGRTVHRIANSLLLLPAAAKAIEEVESWEYLRRLPPPQESASNEPRSVVDYLGIRAKVINRWRGPTEIMVVLRRRTSYQFAPVVESQDTPQLIERPTVQLWFHSVYELRRSQRS